MAFDQFLQVGAQSQMIEISLRSATTGQLLTGVAFGSVTAKYIREGAASQITVSVVTASQGTFTSGGWVETGIAGVYQFGIPNAALVAGAKAVTLVFSASGAIDVVKRIVLVTEDLRDVTIASRAAAGEAPTEAEIIAAMDLDPPAVNVALWKGDTPADLDATFVQTRQDASTPVLTLVYGFGGDSIAVTFPTGTIVTSSGTELVVIGMPSYPPNIVGYVLYVATGSFQSWASRIVAVDGATITIADTIPGDLASASCLMVPVMPPGGVAKPGDPALISRRVDPDSVGSTYDDLLDELCGFVVGYGNYMHIYTVRNSVTSEPVQGVHVWVTDDIGGNNIVRSGTTNASGQVRFFYETPGTYYYWKYSGSASDDQGPDVEVVG